MRRSFIGAFAGAVCCWLLLIVLAELLDRWQRARSHQASALDLERVPLSDDEWAQVAMRYAARDQEPDERSDERQVPVPVVGDFRDLRFRRERWGPATRGR